MSWRFVLVCLAGCGRVSFDLHGIVGDGGPRDAGPRDSMTPPGAIAYWTLDEGTGPDAFDVIGGLDATFINGSSGNPSTWGFGREANAVQFNGDGDNLRILTPDIFLNMPQVSVSAWIRPSMLQPPGVPQCVFDKGEPNGGWAFILDGANLGDLQFGAHFAITDMARTSMPGIVQLNTWQHVVATWDGQPSASSVHIYLDGAEVSYAPGIDGAGARKTDAAIGAEINCNAGTGYAGLTDDVMVFDRVLTPTEVAAFF